MFTFKTKEMKYCPICGKEVEAYYEVTFKEPFIHNNPFEGLLIYGAYSSPKETVCHDGNFLHFAFYNAQGELTDHRLVQLGVEHPTTQVPELCPLDMEQEDEDEETEYGYIDDEELPF